MQKKLFVISTNTKHLNRKSNLETNYRQSNYVHFVLFKQNVIGITSKIV